MEKKFEQILLILRWWQAKAKRQDCRFGHREIERIVYSIAARRLGLQGMLGLTYTYEFKIIDGVIELRKTNLVENLFYDKNPFLDLIKKDDSWHGGPLPLPVTYGNPGQQ